MTMARCVPAGAHLLLQFPLSRERCAGTSSTITCSLLAQGRALMVRRRLWPLTADLLVGPLALLLVSSALSNCAPPAPKGIPTDASSHWELKSGSYWTWTRKFAHGCSAWMAKDEWASVQILTDSQCEGTRETSYLAGSGVSYLSLEDHLTFRGYWPWTDEEYRKLILFDEKGMISEVLPCPNSLSPTQMAELRRAAQEATATAQTTEERQMLIRIQQRLEATDGTNLASSQGGCTDLPPNRDARGQRQRQDAWRRS